MRARDWGMIGANVAAGRSVSEGVTRDAVGETDTVAFGARGAEAALDPDCAVIAEGGGQRGIYTAGVLDAFLEAGFDPFGQALGVSAGAQNLLAFCLRRHGYARRAIAELTASEDFYVPYRWLGAKGVIDLDGYFAHTLEHPDYLLPYADLPRLVGRRRITFVATERDSLEPRYLEPGPADALACMKASSAVPLLYRSGVRVGDEVLIDGGVADPIPALRAFEAGARRVLVVRTTAASAELSSWSLRLARFRRVGALPASVERLLARHERAHAEALCALEHPPEGVEVVQLVPSRPLLSRVFGSRSEALAHDYETGLADGARAARRLAPWTRGEPAIPPVAARPDEGQRPAPA